MNLTCPMQTQCECYPMLPYSKKKTFWLSLGCFALRCMCYAQHEAIPGTLVHVWCARIFGFHHADIRKAKTLCLGVKSAKLCKFVEYSLKPIFYCNAKPFALVPDVGLDPQRHNFALLIPTCWYLKTLKCALPPTRMLKFELSSTPTPNASQWTIGYFGSPTQNFRVGNEHVLISFEFSGQ